MRNLKAFWSKRFPEQLLIKQLMSGLEVEILLCKAEENSRFLEIMKPNSKGSFNFEIDGKKSIDLK